jgi:hypothetical protein
MPGRKVTGLVFDIAAVAQMLKREGEARYWTWLMLEPVRYADRPVEEIFPELVLGSADTLRRFIDGEILPEMAIPEFLSRQSRNQRGDRIVRRCQSCREPDDGVAHGAL